MPVDTPIEIWAPDGAEAILFCAQPVELGRCDGYIARTNVDPAPDACLFSSSSWRANWSGPIGPLLDVPLPWEDDPAAWAPLATCGSGPLPTEVCPSPSGRTEATSRAEWCGITSTDEPSCNYAPTPAFSFPGTTLSQLDPAFVCPKEGPLMSVRDFVVPGEDRETTSRNAGVLGGAYCNLFAPRPMLGRLPGPVGSPGGLPPAAAPLTVFAVRDPAVCELPVEHYGFAEPTLDPGVAQSGQLATVLSGSLLTMSRDGDVGPPASMPVEGEAAVYFGPDGAFALTNFELHQANPEVRYTDSTGTYVVSDGVLRMADLWAGVYEGPGVSPNVTVTAHRSSTTMAFTFNGERWSIPLAPDRPPEGDFDGVDQLVLGAHYYSEPDRAQFELTLRLRIHPRPTAVIDEVLLDRECRPLSDGRLGLVLTASGHSAPGTTTWSLSPEWGPDATFTGPMRVEAGTTATFELPLGAPSDPPYALGFTVLAGGQANSDLRRGISVQDTTGPSFESASITPSCLWPPDHGYALFRLGEEIQAAASDACSPAVRVRISNVVSDQLDDELGSGSTDDDVIFGDTGLCVRSERSGGPRAGRSYTITLEASDAWGNISTHDLVLEVPHDRRAGCPRVPPSLVVADEDIDARCVFAEVPPLDPPRSAFLDPSLTEAVATAIDDSDVSPTETGCSAAPGIRPGASPALALGGLAVLTAISRRRRGRNR